MEFERGDIDTKQMVIIGVLLAVLIGVLVFQFGGKKSKRVAHAAKRTESVDVLAEAAAKLSAPAPAAPETDAPAEPGTIDLEHLDVESLIVPGGRVPAGKYASIDLDPFAFSRELALAYRAMEPAPAPVAKAKPEPRRAVRAAPRPPKPPALDLSAVVVDGAEKVAIINGRVVGIGEKVEGYTLIDVTPRGAKLRRGARETSIALQES